MRYRLSTTLLLLAIVAVSLGWYVDRLRRKQAGTDYLATVSLPTENAVFGTSETIKVRGEFLDGNMFEKTVGDKPTAVVQLLQPHDGRFIIQQSGAASVTLSPDDPSRYEIEFDLSRKTPFSPGIYMLRMKCIVHGKEVVTPSRLVNIISTQSDEQVE